MKNLWIFAFFAVVIVSNCLADLELKSVMPEKIYCHPDETVGMEVEVMNSGSQALSARLVVELRYDLDTQIPLADQEITVESGKFYVWKGSWQAKPFLGLELKATLLRDEKKLAEKSEFFTCARDLHQVLLIGYGNHGGWQFSGTIDKVKDTYPTEFAKQFRSTYGNFAEKFAWAPSDFDDLTPEEDRWWAGQTSYNESKPNMISMINAFHKEGIQAITYGKASGGGIVGYELLRRNPKLAGYTDGRPWLENYDAAYLDYMETISPPKLGEPRMVPGTPEEMENDGYKGSGWFQQFTKGEQVWCSVWYSCGLPKIADIGISELAGSAKMFGFDGVRFDGEFFVSRNNTLDGSFNLPESADLTKANVNLVQKMKKQCWQVNLKYLFGYNTGTEIQWSIPANNTPPEFREKCKDGGLIANEAMAFVGDVPWLYYTERVRRESDIVRYYGGHHATYAFNRGGDRLYNFIVNYAMRSHLMNSYTGGVVDINKFATRFAGFLWDDKLHTWTDVEKIIDIRSNREIWWKSFASVRPSTKGGTQFIVHLINPPEGKTTLSDQKMPSESAKDVKVYWNNPEGFQRVMIADLDTCSLKQIEPQKEGDRLVFSVPEIKYWAILVVEANVPTPEAKWETASSESVKTPSAEDLQIKPKNDEKNWRVMIEPEQWGGGETTADRVKDSDAINGGAVIGKPGRPDDLMAYTYGYPRIAGKYKATFRLKVSDNTVDKSVFKLGIEDIIFHPVPGVSQLSNPTLIVKANDFIKPNVYQDFTVPFEHSDVGFLGVGCRYIGGVDGSWDRTILELIEPWTKERLLQHYAKLTPLKDLAIKRDDTLDVLVVKGLWNRIYHVDDSLAKLTDKTKITNAYTTYHPQHDTQLKGFALDWEPIFTQDVIVLTNIEARGLGLGQVRMIEEFVRQGGGLVILGGLLTLGQNWNMERGWTDFLPVELNMPWEVRQCNPSVKFLQPKNDSPLKGVSWQNDPVVMFRHIVKPKSESKILLSGTNGEPLLVGGQVGNGRVAVFTGTVLGEAPKGQIAFWNSPSWVDILSKTILWSCGRL